MPAQHPLNPALIAWAADIKKASNGTITATLFPSEQLGKAFDHYDMARDGIADFAYVNPGYQPGRFPVMAGAGLPFIFAERQGRHGGDRRLVPPVRGEGDEGREVLLRLHPRSRHLPRPQEEAARPNDIKGLKVRPATSTIGQMVTLLGGTNVQASAPEARDMLERGVADAITFPWGSIFLFGIDKVVKYHMDVPLYVDAVRLGR